MCPLFFFNFTKMLVNQSVWNWPMIPHYTQICTQFTYRNFTWSDECGIRIMNISTRTSRMWENLLEIIEALQLTRELFQPSNSSIVSILPLVNLKGETRRCLFLVLSNWIQNETETSYSEIINFFSSKNPINWIPRKKNHSTVTDMFYSLLANDICYLSATIDRLRMNTSWICFQKTECINLTFLWYFHIF